MKRVVIIKDGQKYYGRSYEDKEQKVIYGYSDITFKDSEELSIALKEFGFYRYEFERWYVEKIQEEVK